MLVSHASTEVQAAALGINGVAEEVKVTTNAEFMMTIAHGIYSNKPLALARELLCNARDGHAKAGTPDAVIEVTLTENKLVVRDQGTGIPNAKFAGVYMTFGESTKKDDPNATGGFGVGTKVPWAVCDTYSARNWIEGKMTAYSIMKADPKIGGKPSCTPVMSAPSTEHPGVEVSVPFPEKLYSAIKSMVIAFARELYIPVKLNGQLISPSAEQLEQKEELYKEGFTFIDHPSTVIQSSEIYLRLGDVIYPVEMQDEFQEAFKMLNRLNSGLNKPYLFLAEPNSVVPTMSRESLSYTDKTILSIKALLVKALQVIADQIDEAADKTKLLLPDKCQKTPDFSTKMWSYKFEPNDVLRYVTGLFPKETPTTQAALLLNNMSLWLRAKTPYLETAKTNGSEFRKFIEVEISRLYCDQLKAYSDFDYQRLVEIWKLRESGSKWGGYITATKPMLRNSYEEAAYWSREVAFHDDILDAVVLKSANELRYIAGSSKPENYFLSLAKMADDSSKEAAWMNYEFTVETMYISKIVVISPIWRQLMERNSQKMRHRPSWSSPYSTTHANLLGARILRVRPSIKAEEVAKLKAKYVSAGYEVLDLMEPTPEEIAERERLAAERAALRDVPLPVLHELFLDRVPRYPEAEAKKTKKHIRHLAQNSAFKGQPLYFILPRGKELPYNFQNLMSYKKLIKFIGTDIVCVSTKPEIARVIKEGRKSVEDTLVAYAKRFFSGYEMHVKLFYRNTFFVKRAGQNKHLCMLLFNRIPPVFTDEEEIIFASLNQLSEVFPALKVYLHGGLDPVTDRIERGRLAGYGAHNCTPAKHYEKVFDTYTDTHFCDVRRALDKAFSPRPSPKRALAREILKTILKEDQNDRPNNRGSRPCSGSGQPELLQAGWHYIRSDPR